MPLCSMLRIPMELRRLMWFMGFIVFSAFILIWYHQRSYGFFLSSLGKNGLKSQNVHVPLKGSSAAANHLEDDRSYSSATGAAMNKSSNQESGLYNISPVKIPQGADPPSKNKRSYSDFFNGSSKTRLKGQPDVVVSISAMNDMLRQSRLSYESEKPKWASQVDEELLNTRKLIEGARVKALSPGIHVDVYKNYSEFVRSYELMESTLKIYIYAEGEKPVFHKARLYGKYASEGWFMKLLQENKQFATKNASEAHLFYLPFSSKLLKSKLYVPASKSYDNLVAYLSLYLENITTRYQFWNRTGGTDHFLVACHDWAPSETSTIMNNCIRALCNTNAIKRKFIFGKDVSLPITRIRNTSNPLQGLGGKGPSERSVLVFFAGKMNGYLRPILLSYWENKDPDIKVVGTLHQEKGEMSYVEYMQNSKYCISGRGYSPFNPRVVEAIFYECVPLIISDNYVPPFFETLNWESFAVFVPEKDIPNLKKILLSISEEKYNEMQERVKQVQKHFLWHKQPVKHDAFYTVLHSIWYTRVFQMR